MKKPKSLIILSVFAKALLRKENGMQYGEKQYTIQ